MKRLPALLLRPSSAAKFFIEIVVELKLPARSARLDGVAELRVVGYERLSVAARERADELAAAVLAWGGWRVRAGPAVAPGRWSWNSSHSDFSAALRRIHCQSNTGGSGGSPFQLIFNQQQFLGIEQRSQRITVIFEAER